MCEFEECTSEPIRLSAADRSELATVAANRNSPQKHVWRAKIVLLTADGHGTADIMRATGKAKTVIWRWQERFGQEGVTGLWRDKTRPARIPPLRPEVAERVVALTLAGPPPTASHWTGAAMAKPAGISISSVQRIWRAHGLRPHLVRRFKLSHDPQFAAKLKEIFGLYINPPNHAIVLSVMKKIPWGVGGDRRSSRVRLLPNSLWRRPMQIVTDRPQAPTAICNNLGAIFVSLELSRSTWLVTSLSPGGGEKMSKHTVRSGDVAGLRTRFSQLKDKVQIRMGQVVPIIVIQEAGLDGFWIHRLLQDEGVESHVVDPASFATSRRRRRAKTDKIDGEALVRALLAYKRGEPRVCAMVRAPTPYEEDRRRICRERKTLTAERVEHVNRIKGLLFAQGISDYEPLLRKRRARLEELRTGDGRPLPQQLKAQIGRELDRFELTLEQIKSVETERMRCSTCRTKARQRQEQC